MFRILAAISLVLGLSSCILQYPGLLMPKSGFLNPYGKKYEIGERLDCGCFEIESFDEYLRSKPLAQGADSYIGYLDYGSHGYSQPWVIFPGEHPATAHVGSEIRAFEPAHKEIWDETRLLSGSIAPGVVFEAYIPGVLDDRSTPGFWIVERDPVLVRGVILERCDRRFLLMKATRDYPHDDEVGDRAEKKREESRARLARSFDKFLANVHWKSQE